MKILITDQLDSRYAAFMGRGVGAKTAADYRSFAQQSRQQTSMLSWFAVMDFAAGKWVDVETDHLFADQFNIGDPPGFTPPVDRSENASGARVSLSYVDAIDFAPEFQTPEEYLAAVQRRHDGHWPGSKVSRELVNRIKCGVVRDETQTTRNYAIG